ncbi:aKG-HExxH-type peptide beta-hydroxylase [Pseudosporangium ferrugineum]|uniref:HEXXH motif-containing protein n=1 Tax=Pseudosporangium ferrugineum TaxID=439699 RepID=A0A2T0S7B9_9ACTN|nr:HEXXH motif-containing putative peptide modification protein [Pseudosporangium ferrugineum]PRY29310.1 HEXXH motif-containing protein [Pseudosporangium ferrugineum]
MRPLTLTTDELDSLASGHGSDEAITQLLAGQLAKRRILLWGVVRDARAAGRPVEAPVRLLLSVHAHSPRTVDEVLSHPQVDAWASTYPKHGDLGYLHALAATAAIRAGLPFTLDVPPSAGAVTLPGLGALTESEVPLRLAFDGAALTADGKPAAPGPRSVVDLGDLGGPAVAVEDVDQYRDRYGMPLADRRFDLAGFTALCREGWKILLAGHPRHARIVGRMVRSFVPLQAPGDRTERSASSSHACGSLAIAPPATGTSMAMLLLHETQHLKLGAVLDLVDLDSGDREPRYRAPWRGDPRPIRGLLQGTYAHLGVTDFWRRHDRRQFAYWRAQTAQAAATLARSGELTITGSRFVRRMRDTLDAWAQEPVSPGDLRIAGICGAVNELVWLLANRRIPASARAELVTAWRNGSRPPPAAAASGADTGVSPRILAAVRAGATGLPAGDRALLAGDPRAAAGHYRSAIVAGAGNDDDWAGLTLALGGSTRPELARDLYAALAGDGSAPDPRDAVRWCATID